MADSSPAAEWADWPIRRVGNSNGFVVGDGGLTVTDTLTGRMWQRRPTDDMRGPDATALSMSFETARDHCRAMSLAGHTDWRLPTLMEAVSIIDFSRIEPALSQAFYTWDDGKSDPDAAGFAATGIWTTTIVAGGPSARWGVGFQTGETGPNALDERHPASARCVRLANPGAPRASDASALSRYTYPSPGIVYDPRTRLTWQRTPPERKKVNWDAAHAYCAKLLANGGNWRLPQIGELVSIVDVSKQNPAIDTEAFPGTLLRRFWSDTASESQSGRPAKFAVDFADGEIVHEAPDTWQDGSFAVRCVRGGAAR